MPLPSPRDESRLALENSPPTLARPARDGTSQGSGSVAYAHPHPDPGHVMSMYRKHILGSKRKWGTARGLIHYGALVQAYLAAKRAHVNRDGDV